MLDFSTDAILNAPVGRLFIPFFLAAFLLPGFAWAVEPALSDREIAEGLTRLETRLDPLEATIEQLREDMNIQFDRQFQLTLALLGAFTILVAGTIGFAVWDRRTMIRPFERTVKNLEDDLHTTRNQGESLLEAFRASGQRDPAVAAVLKQFHLL